MNKAYKVVFNKLRGTMMVVNEATSSVQRKSIKTVFVASLAVGLGGIFSVNAAEIDGSLVDGQFNFDQNHTIQPTADSQETSRERRFAGIIATQGNTEVSVANGSVLTVRGDLSNSESARAYGAYCKTDKSLTVTGTTAFEITAQEKMVIGFRSWGNTTVDTTSFIGQGKDIIGADVADGGTLTFNGDETYIHLSSESGRIIGLQNYLQRRPAVANFNADLTKIILNNNLSSSRAEAILTSGGTSNFNGNVEVTVTAGSASYNYGVNSYCDSQNTIVNFNGQSTKITVSAIGSAYSVNSSGYGSVTNFTGPLVDITSTSIHGGAVGLRSQYGAKINISGDVNITTNSLNETDSGWAEAISVGNYGDRAGNIIIEGNLSALANSIGSEATTISNYANSNASPDSPSSDGTLRVKGRVVAVSDSRDGIASAVWSEGDLAKTTFESDASLSAQSTSNCANGIYSGKSSNVKVLGNASVVVDGQTEAFGIRAEESGTINLGNSNATVSISAKAHDDDRNGIAVFASGSGLATITGSNIQIQGRIHSTNNGKVILKGNTTITYKGAGAAIVVDQNATFDVNGTLTIGGYIDNAGTVMSANGAKVSLVLTDDMISNGEYDLVRNTNTGSVGSVTWNTISFENALYDIAWIGETGTVSIKQKSAESLVESLPVTTQQAGIIAAILPTATAPATPELDQIANAIRSAATSGNGEAIAQIAEDLAPSTAPVVSHVTQNVNNALVGVANARLAANRAAGDVFTGGSAWAQMIYNSADQDATKKTAELESDTYGITVGVDGKIGDNLTIGAGFGVTKTDAESGTRDIDVDSYSLFGYTEYNADNGWFVNGMATAIRGRYEENKVPAGIKLTAKYQTTVLGAGVATGYHFENGISPEVGLRYLRTHQGSYNDGAQKIHTDGTNLLTASLGAKYEKAFEQGDWLIKPTARVAATYDVVSDDTESAIRVIGGGQYHVISEHQKRAAFEAGLGLEASNGDWDFSVAYNGEFRNHFKSHTGMIKAKYNF